MRRLGPAQEVQTNSNSDDPVAVEIESDHIHFQHNTARKRITRDAAGKICPIVYFAVLAEKKGTHDSGIA